MRSDVTQFRTSFDNSRPVSLLRRAYNSWQHNAPDLLEAKSMTLAEAHHHHPQRDTNGIAGVAVPDSKLARDLTQFVRDTESPLLFHHSSRVYYWGALAGKRRRLQFDAELLYAGAMFHDMGLTDEHSSADERFEVDSANAARKFLRSYGIAQHDIDMVWTAIALHTTPGIPQHMRPVVALVTAGVEMDVLGLKYGEYSDAEREAVVQAHPRTSHFKEDIIQAFYEGNKHKPETTFGNVNADLLTDKDPHFSRGNFCSVIRGSAWRG